MSLKDLDNEITRRYMKEIVQSDKNLYYSDSRFNLTKEQYISLLLKSIESWDIDSFAKDLWNNIKKIDNKWHKVPSDAHIVLWYWEFNRYYIASILKQAIETELNVRVYRFRDVEKPRIESEKMIWDVIKWVELELMLNNLLSADVKIRFSSEFCKPNSWITIMLF